MKPSRRDRREKRALKSDYLEPLVTALGDATVLAGVRVEELQPIAYQLALYFGHRRDPATSAVLGEVYDRLLNEVEREARAELVDDLMTAIASGSTSVLALLPVLQRETEAELVRTAALVFATRMAPTAGDTLTGPRMVRTLLEHAEPDGVRAGLVGALLALGDARVVPLLEGAWRVLAPAAADALLALPRPMATRLEVEWLLSWLEDAEPARFTAVAASLARLAHESGGVIVEVEREIPAGPSGDALTLLREWTPRALAQELAPRFESLARRAAPGALDEVQRAFAG